MKENKKPIISVVMLNYNGINYIKRTIPPLLKLNYPNYEIIIVDNGSTDGSIEYINSIKNIKLIRSPRKKRKNFACNYAIKQAKGEYILLLDNDILINQKNILKELYNRASKTKK
jgi:glycosyltransferase involved in cell wall biosynthesis